MKESSEKEREDWFEPGLNIHTPLSSLSPIICLFFPLQHSNQRKLFLGRNNTGGNCPPPPTPPNYAHADTKYAHTSLQKHGVLCKTSTPLVPIHTLILLLLLLFYFFVNNIIHTKILIFQCQTQPESFVLSPCS